MVIPRTIKLHITSEASLYLSLRTSTYPAFYLFDDYEFFSNFSSDFVLIFLDITCSDTLYLALFVSTSDSFISRT